MALAQSPTQDRGYWVDRSTGLMWAGKDNGKDVSWQGAVKYCRDLRLVGNSDWRIATIKELQGIYDAGANSPGLAGKHASEAFMFPVKGKLFLTGDQWSTTQRNDDRGRPSGLAWYFDFVKWHFDFVKGIRKDDDTSRFTGRFASSNKRALCARDTMQR